MIRKRLKSLAAGNADEIIGIRRHLHAHPELSFKEHETSRYVCSILDRWGIAYATGYADTGIVAEVNGTGSDGKAVALRADMDALPITEKNDVPYCSVNPGVMHACGHDVHTSSLLGAAKALHSLKNDFGGTVKLLFQPGEEILPGGATLMIKDGALENPRPSTIIGQHVMPELAVGKVGFRSGMYMASADEIHFTVTGKGGHAALPERNIDPVLITSHLIVALQQVVSRRCRPDVPCVLSFGKVQANGATNVIPDRVDVAGTFRTMDEDWRTEAHRIMKDLAEGTAAAMDGSCDFRIGKGYPSLSNDEALTEIAKLAAIDYLGPENVVDLDIRMTGEDFGFYTHVVPGCFYRLGTGNVQKGIASGIHTATFDVDEQCLSIGSGLMAYLALKQLQDQ